LPASSTSSTPGLLAGYAKAPVRWKHTAEIRRRYGYRDFASEPAHIGLLRHLYRQAWVDDLGPTALFRAAHRRLLAERVILPGENVLTRTVASIRERATQRLWTQLAKAAPKYRPWPSAGVQRPSERLLEGEQLRWAALNGAVDAQPGPGGTPRLRPALGVGQVDELLPGEEGAPDERNGSLHSGLVRRRRGPVRIL